MVSAECEQLCGASADAADAVSVVSIDADDIAIVVVLIIDRRTLMHWAAYADNTNSLSSLKSFASVSWCITSTAAAFDVNCGSSPLMTALYGGRTQASVWLIDHATAEQLLLADSTSLNPLLMIKQLPHKIAEQLRRALVRTEANAEATSTNTALEQNTVMECDCDSNNVHETAATATNTTNCANDAILARSKIKSIEAIVLADPARVTASVQLQRLLLSEEAIRAFDDLRLQQYHARQKLNQQLSISEVYALQTQIAAMNDFAAALLREIDKNCISNDDSIHNKSPKYNNSSSGKDSYKTVQSEVHAARQISEATVRVHQLQQELLRPLLQCLQQMQLALHQRSQQQLARSRF